MSEGDIDEFGGLEVHCQGGRAMKDQKGLMTSRRFEATILSVGRRKERKHGPGMAGWDRKCETFQWRWLWTEQLRLYE